MSTSAPAQWLDGRAAAPTLAGSAGMLLADLELLQLPTEVLTKLQNLGVHELSDVIELELRDLEDVGLSRLQVRRLQALASSRSRHEDEAPPPPPPGPPPQVPRRRSRSPQWPVEGAVPRTATVRQRSASSKRSVRFRSVSSVHGLDFEQDCRREILTWMDGWAVELCPKALGIHHDCDLLLRLLFKALISKTMPAVFHLVSSPAQLHEKGQKDALLFFEMKSCAARVEKAIEQLRTRRELALTGSTTEGLEIFLIAIVALRKNADPQYHETLVKHAKEHPDIFIVWVDPDDLGGSRQPQEEHVQRQPMFNDDYYTRKQARERRFVFEGKYSGVIQCYYSYCGFGYLVPNDPLDLMPPGVREAIESNQWHGLYFRGIDLAEGVTLSKGTHVEFQVYTDKHSAGACNITILWQGW